MSTGKKEGDEKEIHYTYMYCGKREETKKS
jgi:hypothetical protein